VDLDSVNISAVGNGLRMVLWFMCFFVAFTISSATLVADRNGYRKTTLILFIPLAILFAVSGGVAGALTIGGLDLRDVLILPLVLVSVGMLWFYKRIKAGVYISDDLAEIAVRDATANVREVAADLRDAENQARRAASDARDAAADARTVAANARDAVADARAIAADARTVAADARDVLASARNANTLP